MDVVHVHTSNKDDATIAVAGVIHQDTDPEQGEVPDLEGYHQKEGVQDVKLGEDLPEDQRHMLKDLTQRYPDVLIDIPGETDVIQHRVKLTDDTHQYVVSLIPCRTPCGKSYGMKWTVCLRWE